jgi:hypothetical protein
LLPRKRLAARQSRALVLVAGLGFARWCDGARRFPDTTGLAGLTVTLSLPGL